MVSTLTFEHYTSFINRLDKISAEQLDGLKKIRLETQDKYDKYKELMTPILKNSKNGRECYKKSLK